MSQPQCHYGKSPVLCAALKASDLPSNRQRYIISKPLSQLGLNNGTIYGTQGKRHIYDLTDHESSYTTTGNHLRDMIESHKIYIGYSGPIFTENFQALYQSITPSSIFHTCQFMREKNLFIE